MAHSSRQKGPSLRRAAFLALTVLGLVAASASAQETHLRTLAGMSPAGDFDGTGAEARFNAPTGIAVTADGTLYVADQQNCFIRKVTAAGSVTRFAGTIFGDLPCGSGDGAAGVAQFSFATGIAADSAGNLYVADTNNNTIRKITPAGVASTLAGLAGNVGSADATGSAARFNRPAAIAVDSAGIVYVADTNNHTIRQITPAGVVTTLAGLPGSPGNADGTGTAARFNNPRGIAVDGAGNLYVADTNNHTIRKIAAGAIVTTMAGTAGMFGSTNGTGSAARFNQPRGLAVDSAGTVYVADTNNQRIRQVTAAADVTTLAGNGAAGGFDGPAADARFNNPEGVTVDAAGVVYVADTTSDTIRKIASGNVTTLAGFPGSLGFVDAEEFAARFAYPFGVAVDSNRNLYIADRNNNAIRKISPTGGVTTLAGSSTGLPGSTDGTGTAARFNFSRGLAVDSAGTVYVADTGNHTIRTITPNGVVATLAGLAGSFGSTDGTGSAARFSSPSGIAVDSTGLVYVADSGNHTIRRIGPGGLVTTLAGLAGSSGGTDGAGSIARFNAPRGLAVDAAGVLYVADMSNHTIRSVTPAGVVTTLAGQAGAIGFFDGTGNAARFNGPQGIAVGSGGTLYVGDTNNHAIRRIAPGNIVTRFSGCGCFGGENWGRFNQPVGIAVDSGGFVYVADSRNNSIRTTAPLGMGLAVDFGPAYGIWLRRGTTWRQVHPYTAEAMVAIRSEGQDALVIDFGPGVGVWFWQKGADGNEEWFQIHSLSPDAMAGVDFDGDGEVEAGVFSFPGAGLWLFDGETGQWSLLHSLKPSQLMAANLDGVGGDELIMDFTSYGLWTYSAGSWTHLHPLDVSTMTTADIDGNGKEDLIVNFPGFGVWAYMNGTAWAPIHPFNAKRLASADLDGNGVPELIVDFDTGVGVWVRRNAATWNLLHSASPENIVTGDLDANGHDEMFADFGAAGIWSYQDGPGWTFVHAGNPTGMATGRLR